MPLTNGSDVKMEFKLLDKYGKEVVIVKRINLHSYSLIHVKYLNIKNGLIYLLNLNMIEKFVQKQNLIIQY